jgi:outer membrane protein assembly factor BamB
MRRLLLIFFICCAVLPLEVRAQSWSAKLDDTVRFYQPTDVGAVIVGTKKSVYAVDSMTGDVLWRRKDPSLDENDVAPVPGTDMVLLSFEKGSRTRIEAVDALSGDRIWQSEKLRGAVMHMPQAEKTPESVTEPMVVVRLDGTGAMLRDKQ